MGSRGDIFVASPTPPSSMDCKCIAVVSEVYLIHSYSGRYAGGPSSPLAVIHVVWGLRYRFRLVSYIQLRFTRSVTNHRMGRFQSLATQTSPSRSTATSSL